MTSKRPAIFAAVIGFAILNTACWWYLTRDSRTEPEIITPAAIADVGFESGKPATNAAQTEAATSAATLEPLVPLSVALSDYTAGESASFDILFSGAIQHNSIAPDQFRIMAGGVEIQWKMTKQAASSVRIETTQPIDSSKATVEIASGVSPASDKTLSPSHKDYSFDVVLVDELVFNGANAAPGSFESPYILASFSRIPDISKISDFVVCEPKVQLSFSGAWEWYEIDGQYFSGNLRISGDFETGRQYKITFLKGLPSRDGQLLTSDVSSTLAMPHRKANVDFAVPGRYLPPGGSLAVPVKTINITNLAVSVSQVLPQNLVQLMAREDNRYANSSASADSSASRELSRKPLKYSQSVSATVDAIGSSTLNLANIIGNTNCGIYLVEAEGDDIHYGGTRSATRLVCITDMGVTARAGKDRTHMWITSLRGGTPVPGVNVSIYSAAGEFLGDAVTAPDGTATIAHTVPDVEPFLATAKKTDGSDLSFVPISSLTSVYEKTGATAEYLDEGASHALVFTDRGIYRHGETVNLQALLRNGNAEAPPPFPVVLEMVKPDGRVFRTFSLMPDALGAITPPEALAVPENQPSGAWMFRVKLPGESGALLGSRTIRIESFVPPQIRVEFTSIPENEVVDKPLKISAHAEHLFGNPAAGLKAEAAVTYADSAFSPDGWEGYSFGDASRSIAANYAKIGSGRLNENGDASFDIAPLSSLTPKAAIGATFETTVFEPGGRPVSTRRFAQLHKYPHYIGIKTPESSVLALAQSNTVAIAAVALDGTRLAAPVGFEAGLYSISRIYSYTHDPSSGQYTWNEETVKSPVWTKKVASYANSDATLEFAAQNTGEFMLVVSDGSGGSASWEFSVEDGATSQQRSAMSSPTRLEMKFDRPSYTAGQTARLQITAPFAGTAMLVLQRDRIMESRLIEMTNTTTVVDIPVTAAMFPNIHASATLVRPAAPGKAWSAHRASGMAMLKVERPENRLEISCAPAVEIVEGGSRITASLSVQGANPGDILHAAVYATDEAIHILTGEKTPDPYAFFSAPCRPGASLYDIFNLLMPITEETPADANAKTGGDGASPLLGRISPVASRRFKPLSLATRYEGRVGEDGTCTFKLPEFSGEVRVTAIAWTARATGSASRQIKVSPRIVAKPDAPRFLASGDSANLSLTLHNTSTNDEEVSCSVAFTEPLIGDAAAQTIRIKAGGSATLRFPARAAEAVGHGAVTFRAEGAGESHVETLEIPVRPAMPLVTTLETIAMQPGESITLQPPDGVIASTVMRSVRGHDSYYSQFIPAVQYLVAYPFGCLEQTASSAFPLVNAGGVLSRFAAGETLDANAVRAKIDAAILRVSAMQAENGYWIWHDVRSVNDDLSVYACHFLGEAARNGYAVQPSVRKTNIQLLIRIANRALLSKDFPLAAYACHVLALLDAPERPTMMALYDFRSSLPDAALAHLSRAFSLSGDRDRARELLAPVTSPSTIEAASFGILAVLELGDPDSGKRAAAMFTTLSALRSGSPHWSTTRRNSMALLAIGALAQRLADPSSELRIAVNDASGANIQIISNMEQTVRTGARTISIRNEGKGKSYIINSVAAIPSKLSFEGKANGIEIARIFKDASGNVVDTDSLKPGDLVIVELDIRLAADSDPISDAIVEELLPACLEPEQGSLAASGSYAWINKEAASAIMRQDIRDDRLVFFLNPLSDRALIHYAARVVTTGSFTVPPASVEAMYIPEISARTAPGDMTISE